MSRRRPRSVVATGALAAVALVATAACGREPGFEDRTARVTFGGRTTTFTLDSCGLDGSTIFLVGRTDSGIVLQAVVGLEDDGETGIPESTGFSVDDPEGAYAAFGAESWSRRGEDGPAPGSISSARLRGARVQVEGEAQSVDAEGAPSGTDASDVALDARCDEQG